jgi:hypothetical protein
MNMEPRLGAIKHVVSIDLYWSLSIHRLDHLLLQLPKNEKEILESFSSRPKVSNGSSRQTGPRNLFVHGSRSHVANLSTSGVIALELPGNNVAREVSDSHPTKCLFSDARSAAQINRKPQLYRIGPRHRVIFCPGINQFRFFFLVDQSGWVFKMRQKHSSTSNWRRIKSRQGFHPRFWVSPI